MKLPFNMYSFIILQLMLAMMVAADQNFDNLVSAGKYNEALEYADEKIPPASRDAAVWSKIARANELAGMREKALASYMVSWRLSPENYDALLGSARIYNDLKQWEQGAGMAEKALEQKFTGEASWEYARACIELKKPAEAKKALIKVIETDPANVVANRELGQIFYNDKEYSQAIPLLKKSYSEKADPEVAYRIGKSSLEVKNNSDAIEYLGKAFNGDKSMYNAGLELARVLFTEGKSSDAAKAYAAIKGKIKITSDDEFNWAESLEKSGQGAEAVEVYRSAVNSFGNSTDKKALVARNIVGKSDLSAKKYQSANEQFLFLVAKDPKADMFKDSYFNLTESYIGLKNSTSAIATLEKLLSFDTKNVEAYARLAELYTKSNNPVKAKATFEKLMTLSPNDPNVYLTLGDYNLKAKNYTEALNLFVKANSLEKSATALEGIAIAASNMNQWDKARDAAESAVMMDSKLYDARVVLAQALVRAKNYSEAKDHLEILVAKEPKNTAFLVDLATCYENLKKTEDLASVDKKLIVLQKDNTVSRFRYAEYALSKNLQDEAYGIFKELAVLSSKTASVFKNLFFIAKAKSDKVAALTYLKTYAVLNPKDAELIKELGDMQYDAKDLDGALDSYRKVIALDPKMGGFYKRYAEIVMKKGLQDEVIKALNGVIANGGADHNTYTTLGLIYMQKAQYSNAKAMYEKALSIKPQDTESLIALGECFLKLKDVNGALITYQQAAMMDPKSSAAHKALGDLYTMQKKGDEAMKSYLAYLDLGNSDSKLSLSVGMSFYNKKEWASAVKYLEGVTGADATQFSYLLALCESAFNSGAFEKAIQVADKILPRNPSAATKIKVLEIKAVAYEKLKKLSDAVDAYDALYKINKNEEVAFKRAFLREGKDNSGAEAVYKSNIVSFPNDSRNYLQLGLMYSKSEDKAAQAVAMLEKAAVKAGKNKEVWQTIAKLYGTMGNDAKELDAYKKYLAVDPQDVEANIRIGAILIKQGKTTDGMIYLETANALSPNNPAILLPLADGYLASNRNSEAAALIAKARDKDPGNVELRKKLFSVYMKMGEQVKAMAEIQQVVDNNKDDHGLLRMYADLLLNNGKPKEAEAAIEDILAVNPEDIDALLILAKIHRSRKKYNEAIEVYKEISFIQAENPIAHYERAETHMEMGQVPWAERFYERALRADPKLGRALVGKGKILLARNDQEGYKGMIRKAMSVSPDDPVVIAEAKKAGLK